MINEITKLKMQKLTFQRILIMLEEIDELSTPGHYETSIDGSLTHTKIATKANAIHDILINAINYGGDDNVR